MTETPGQQLKAARLARGISLEQVAQATRIRFLYLQAIERDELDALPSAVHARGFIRNYAGFRGIDPQVVLGGGPNSQPDLPPLEPAPVDQPARDESRPEPVAETPVEDRPAETPASDTRSQASPDKSTGPARRIPRVEPPAGSEKSESQAIFEEIGRQLQQRRETLSLSLGEVERHTHVRLHYLKALEAGQLDELPSSVQARGMLSNYAHFLNLDVNTLLLRFADGLQARRVERLPAGGPAPSTPRKRASAQPAKEAPRGLARYLTFDLLAVGGLIVVMVLFVIWGASQVLKAQPDAGATPATLPGVAEMLLTPMETGTTTATAQASSGEPTLTPTLIDPVVVADQETAVAEMPAQGDSTLQVYVVARARAWMRVSVDGDVIFSGRAERGSAYPFAGQEKIEVLTGDASALQVFYNQVDMGALGGEGQVISLIFTADGVQTPTPTITPTPTRTPKVPPTETPQPSPKPSNTPAR
jgi:cytoskeletal protein RodZ